MRSVLLVYLLLSPCMAWAGPSASSHAEKLKAISKVKAGSTEDRDRAERCVRLLKYYSSNATKFTSAKIGYYGAGVWDLTNIPSKIDLPSPEVMSPAEFRMEVALIQDCPFLVPYLEPGTDMAHIGWPIFVKQKVSKSEYLVHLMERSPNTFKFLPSSTQAVVVTDIERKTSGNDFVVAVYAGTVERSLTDGFTKKFGKWIDVGVTGLASLYCRLNDIEKSKGVKGHPQEFVCGWKSGSEVFPDGEQPVYPGCFFKNKLKVVGEGGTYVHQDGSKTTYFHQLDHKCE